MKNALLVVPLLSAGLLAAGCAASSTSSTPGASTGAAGGSSSSAPASAGSGASSTGASGSATTGASASASSGSGSTTVSAGAPACTSADLTASLGGGAGAGMSQNHTGLQLRNTGSSACTLYGYPGVSWVRGAAGTQTGAAAVRQADPNGTEKVVTLAPGALASAPLDIVDAAVIPPSECKPVAVRGLRIYPPGQKAALFLSLPTAAGGYGECSLATKSPTLMIGYLEAGAQPGGGSQG
ncbi:MAG TPA: DUF4232 domain-containing protein [Streptosporangiaceae bacterium]